MTRTGAKRRFEVTNSVSWKGETLQKGDSVMVQAYNDVQPYIGQVQQITKQRDDHYLEVSWFYRPEEAIGGRRPFHGEKELFKSTHLQQISLDTVLGKCQVLSLDAYEGLSEVDDSIFFSRFTYHPVDHRFYPDQVYVYCECQFPYNPDKFMVQCDNCEDWFHPKCVDLSQAEVEELKNSNKKYICRSEKCQKTLAKRQKIDQGELMPGRTIQTTVQSTTENQPAISNQINNVVNDKNKNKQQDVELQNGENQVQNGNKQIQSTTPLPLEQEKVTAQTDEKSLGQVDGQVNAENTQNDSERSSEEIQNNKKEEQVVGFENKDKNEENIVGFENKDKNEENIVGFENKDENEEKIVGNEKIDENEENIVGNENKDENEEKIVGNENIDENIQKVGEKMGFQEQVAEKNSELQQIVGQDVQESCNVAAKE